MAKSLSGRGFAPFMQQRGIPLFTVLGIRVVAHYSWFLIVALIVWVLTVGWFPTVLPGISTARYITLGLITAFFFFASVLVHELMHSVVAVLSGIPVRRITLFLFGGIAEILREPSDPGTELRIALAGPAASAAVAAVCWALVAVLGADTARPGLRLAIYYIAIANTSLLVFNLLPGLPLDGGRVLRAIIWRATKNLRRATHIASMAGRAISALMVVAGIVAALWGRDFKLGIWLVFIALFMRQAADASYKQIVMRESLSGIRIASVMTGDVVTVPSNITLSRLIDNYLLRYHFTCYPVVSEGRPVGLITLRGVKRVPRPDWDMTRVDEAMDPLSPGTCLSPDDDIPTTMEKMTATGLGRLPVIDADGNLVGIVSRRDVMNYLQIRSDLTKGIRTRQDGNGNRFGGTP
ncbi:MAG: site-2 protease family protein [Candidatus Eisenbacteria bacterium]|nr:site-2 protease family protein [Candidatus Eisenbacteria bacterium]